MARVTRHAQAALVLVALSGASVTAQEPVARVPDVASWITAGANTAGAIVEATRSDDAKCRLGQLAVSEAIGLGVAFTLQHVVISARPCLGCAPNGMPSAHVTQSLLGSTASAKGLTWGFSIGMAIGTAEGRDRAHRHTRAQQAAGFALGSLAEWGGHRIIRCR